MSLLDNPSDTIYVSGSVFDTEIVIAIQDQSLSNVLSVNGQIGNVIIDTGNFITGVDLTPYVTKSGGQFINRPTLNGTGFLLSGEAASLPETIVYTTGNQTISGDKNFIGENLSFGRSTKITTDSDFLYIRRADGEMILSSEEYILLDDVYPTPKTSLYWGGRTLNNISGYPVLDWSNPEYISITNNLLINGTGVKLNAAKNITYSQLTGLKNTSGLVPGDFYIITDYITKWRVNSINTNQVLSGKYIEPLIVQSVSVSEINNRAYSTLYPRDEIYYNSTSSGSWPIGINSSLPVPNSKGYIYRRKDPDLNIDIGLDWRNVTMNCCKLNLSGLTTWNISINYQQQDLVKYNGNLYFSKIDNNIGNIPNGDLFWELLASDSTYIPTNEEDWKILSDIENEFNWRYSIPFNTGSRQQFPIFSSNITGNAYLKLSGVSNILIETCSNTVFDNSSYDFIKNLKIVSSYNTLFGSNCSDNEISYIEKNIIGLGFRYNQISQSINNIIGENCVDNFFYVDILDNFIGNYYESNIVNSALTANIIGQNCKNNEIKAGPTILYNIIGDNFYLNSFNVDYFQYNTIGDNFYLNSIFGSFYNNKIKNNFESNQITSEFDNNIITGSNCVGNEFKKQFIFNSGIKDSFQNNVIDTPTDSINFSSGTHVYNQYNTRIFKNSSLNYRLGYYGNNDQLIITDPTS